MDSPLDCIRIQAMYILMLLRGLRDFCRIILFGGFYLCGLSKSWCNDPISSTAKGVSL